MRTSFLRFASLLTAAAMLVLSACKSGPSDADIQKAVSEKASAISADVADMNNSVKDGVVTINGMFKDEATKSSFETAVKAIPGVKSVVDNGTLAPAPAPAPAAVVVN